MNKRTKKDIVRTNERCYVCDFSAHPGKPNISETGSYQKPIVGVYQDGLCSLFQDERGRFVFIDPRDDKPVCTQCAKIARDAVKELEYLDRKGEPKSWKESNADLFRKWDAILREEEKAGRLHISESFESSPVHNAEQEAEIKLETT